MVLLLALGCAQAPEDLGESSAGVITDDSTVRISSVATARTSLINYIWGTATLPTAVPTAVTIASPGTFAASLLGVSSVPNLASVTELRSDLGDGVKTANWELIPTLSNGKLVIVHIGHNDTFDAIGPGALAQLLVANGYTVLYATMPCWTHPSTFLACPVPFGFDNGGPGGSHNEMFVNIHPAAGHVQKFFLEDLVRSLNLLAPSFNEIDMAGLSGGGWTTAVYPAVDPRVKISFAVNGSKPKFLSRCAPVDNHGPCLDSLVTITAGQVGDNIGYDGDREQMDEPFYNLVGFLDIYTMAASGAGRRHIQVESRNDFVFGPQQYVKQLDRTTTRPNFTVSVQDSWDQAVRRYEHSVQQFLLNTSDQGYFRYAIDEEGAGLNHVISTSVQQDLILAELEGERRPVGAASANDVYVRGLDGTIRHAPPSWAAIINNGIVGTPAVVESAGATDIFLRDPTDPNTGVRPPTDPTLLGYGTHPSRVHIAGATVTVENWGGIIESDPAAAFMGSNLHMVAVGTDLHLYHWWAPFGLQMIDGSAAFDGPPVLFSTGPTSLDAFVRRTDGAIQHVYFRGGTSWISESLPGASDYRGFPTAVSAGGGLRVYGRRSDDRLWENFQPAAGGAWSIASINAHAAGAAAVAVLGNPSAAVLATGQPLVVARGASGNVVTFQIASGAWQYASVASPAGTTVTLAPVAIPTGFYVRTASRNVYRYALSTSAWTNLFGQID